MTEQEAKTKWCPQSRTLDWVFENGRVGDELQIGAGAVNRDARGEPMGRCIGSACMAWRWKNDPTGPQDPFGPEPSYDGWCGLAGKP